MLPADGRTRIGIKVQDGCDNACTYCIVHVARGRATSRNGDEVVAEAAALARAGVREIVLTGINLGSYDADGLDLADLCRRLLDETADLHGPDEEPCRFRIGSIEPMDVSMDFIGLLAEAGGRLCRHLHLPLQSGSSKVLREMGRPYDAEEYRQLADYLRAMVPEIALTTDIIVGFPGETEEDFMDTYRLVEEVGYSQVFTFIYSKRAGTPAAELHDDTPREVIQERFDRLVDLVQRKAFEANQAELGAIVPVLIEGTSKRDEAVLAGKSPKNQTVHGPVPAGRTADELVGTIVPMRIDEARTWYLSGTVVDG